MKISRLWKLVVALIPAAGICGADMLEEEAIRRTINTDGLAYFWPMEGDGTARLGGVNLTSTNGATYDSPRFGWQSAQTGSNKWFTTASTITLSNTFTVSLWLRVNQRQHSTQGYGMPIGGLTSSEGYINILTNNVFIYNNGETKGVGSAYVIPSNVWTHVVATCSTGQTSLYVNGSLLITSNIAAPFVMSVRAVGISYQTASDGGQRYVWRGLIDEPRIYSRALSSAEVVRVYSEASP